MRPSLDYKLLHVNYSQTIRQTVEKLAAGSARILRDKEKPERFADSGLESEGDRLTSTRPPQVGHPPGVP